MPFRASFHVFSGMVRKLPSGIGSALIGITSGSILSDNRTCPAQNPSGQNLSAQPYATHHPLGSFSVWRLQASELVPLLISPICDTDLLDGFENNFLGSDDTNLPTTIDSYAPVTTPNPDQMADLAQVTYTWDANSQTYVPPATVDQPPDLAQPPVPGELDLPFYQALNRYDYAVALKLIDHALLMPCDQCTQHDILHTHFLRATVLELLHRDSEAVAEYLFVASNATSQAQSALAMRHLEPIDF